MTGNITAGVYAGHSVTAQFKWKPVVSPGSQKYPGACANTAAPGGTGRISIVGDLEFKTKAFTIN